MEEHCMAGWSAGTNSRLKFDPDVFAGHFHRGHQTDASMPSKAGVSLMRFIVAKDASMIAGSNLLHLFRRDAESHRQFRLTDATISARLRVYWCRTQSFKQRVETVSLPGSGFPLHIHVNLETRYFFSPTQKHP
jgi:hypothetical protein